MRLVALLAGVGLLSASAAAAPAPPFSANVSPVRPGDLRHTYRAGCPVRPSQLRLLRLSYWGFDGGAHTGLLVVNGRVAQDVVTVFRRLYAARFPIRRMVLVSRYRGNDNVSMAADNTSAFNCRRIPGSPSRSWSMHAYGEAIDVNPVENPYIVGNRVLPPAGRRFVDRASRRPGMAVSGGVLVNAFAAVGWKWGGNWRSSLDYQHFSTTGR